MSRDDYARDGEAIEGLIGCRFRLIPVTNTLKLCFDPNDTRHRYLWIDPRWRLENPSGSIVAESDLCPLDRDGFRAWTVSVEPVRSSVLTSIAYEAGVGTVFALDGGWRLVSLDGVDPDDDELWYDDYYLRL